MEFAKSVTVDYSFEVLTRVRFEVRQIPAFTGGEPVLVGVSECFLPQLLALNGGLSVLGVMAPDAYECPSELTCALVPELVVFVEEAGRGTTNVRMSLDLAWASEITLHAGSRYSLQIFRGKFNSDDKVLVYRSPEYSSSVTKGVRHVHFSGIEVTSEKLCRGDPWRRIDLVVVESKFTRKNNAPTHTVVAQSQIVYSDLERSFHKQGSVEVLFVGATAGSSATVATATVAVHEIVRTYSYLDYVNAGLEISVVVGIDFTRSNGDPRGRESLHGFTSSRVPAPSNEYVEVIRSVMEILEKYDSDKLFPAYGFGCKLPPSGTRTSHCFAMNGDYFSPEVPGCAGILEAYRSALGVVTLHGPTRLSELLATTRAWAEPMRGGAKYLILLVITDGAIEDFDAVVDEIVALAELPVSVLIVGVGDQDFSAMTKLDADTSPLVSAKTNRAMSRDIVQFVPFRDFRDKPIEQLAAACLEEIPREVVSYFNSQGMFPAVAPEKEDGAGRRWSRQYNGFVKKSGLTDIVIPPAASGAADPPPFLVKQMQDLLATIRQQGYDEKVAERTLKEIGVLCPDPVHAIEIMFHVHANRAVKTNGGSGDRLVRPIRDRLGVTDYLVDGTEDLDEDRAERVSATGSNSADRRGVGRANGPERVNVRAVSDSPPNLGLCRICFTQPVDVQFVPCNHSIVCHDCARQLGNRTCPLCRELVESMEYV